MKRLKTQITRPPTLNANTTLKVYRIDVAYAVPSYYILYFRLKYLMDNLRLHDWLLRKLYPRGIPLVLRFSMLDIKQLLDFRNTYPLSVYNSDECCTFWYLQSAHRLWKFTWYWNTPLQPLSVAHSLYQRVHGMNSDSNAKVKRIWTIWILTQTCPGIIPSVRLHLCSTLLSIEMATYSFTSQAR